jgi:hypothetical protein
MLAHMHTKEREIKYLQEIPSQGLQGRNCTLLQIFNIELRWKKYNKRFHADKKYKEQNTFRVKKQ